VLAQEYRKASGMECEDASWEDSISYLSDSSLVHPANAARSWVYQTCVEFGYFQTANSPNQPFYSFRDLLDVQFSIDICKAAFPGLANPVPDVNWTNTVYGGLNIVDDNTKIVFTSGTIDPWHALGVTNYTTEASTNKDAIVYIQGTAHCADLYAPNAESDPESLTYARQIVADKVRSFLA
jgi:thymus-specific serine protease